MANLRRQLAQALQRNRDLANENFALKGEVANLKLISPSGFRLSSLLPQDTQAWLDLEWAIHRYVISCGGKTQTVGAKPKKGAARGKAKTR